MGDLERGRPPIEDYLGRRARVYERERALLADVAPLGPPGSMHGELMEELASLADTAGVYVVGTLVQQRKRPDPATFLGRGKVAELRTQARELSVDVLIIGSELSPAQARNLEEATDLKVVDRAQLILDIFAQRAGTREAELAVELAQLEYLLPRLRGWGKALTDPGGGIGTRGPGETRIEQDRRRTRSRIQSIRSQLRELDGVRHVRRKQRRRAGIPEVAIIGYTNTGKSTLFNKLTGSQVLAEDKLFATLDTRVRRLTLSRGVTVLIADTVGFIRELPHQLIPAFRATMETTREAALLLNVLDASSPYVLEHYHTVLDVLADQILNQDDTWPPVLHVLNKMDLVTTPEQMARVAQARGEITPHVTTAAREGHGLDELRTAVAAMLGGRFVRVTVRLPHDRSEILAWLADLGSLEAYFDDDEIVVDMVIPTQDLARVEGLDLPLKIAKPGASYTEGF